MSRDQNWSLFILRFPCDFKSLWWCGITFSLWYSDIPNLVTQTKTDIQPSFQFWNKYLTLIHIITHLFFSLIRKPNFDYCWCFVMIYYPNFFIHNNVRIYTIHYIYIYILYTICYTSLIGLEVQKSSEKTQTLPKDHLEHPLRPRWTTHIRIGPFWAMHKRFEVIWPSIFKMVTWKPFPIEEAQHFTKPLKQLCVGISPYVGAIQNKTFSFLS